MMHNPTNLLAEASEAWKHHKLSLSRQEKLALHKENTPEARDKLIRSVLLWAISISSRFSLKYSLVNQDDLVACSMVGAIRGVDTWDPKKGELTTHVTTHCRAEILAHLENLNLIRIPSYLHWYRSRRTAAAYCIEAATSARQITSIPESAENQNSYNPEKKESEYAKTEEWHKEYRHQIKKVLHLLTDRERTILRCVATGNSIKEIAKKLNFSQTTVLKYKNRAINKLQEALSLQVTLFTLK